jgi:hypothetical protein
MWLPVAHDVAVTPTPCTSKETRLVEMQDDSQIRAIDAAVFKQSTAIAGRSRALIVSLAHSH